MKQTLSALERRFELRVLYVFNLGLWAILIAATVQYDWWLLGICLVALFLNGLIGKDLHKNKHKSFWQLAAGSKGERDIPNEEPESEYVHIVARSASRFQYLATITAAVIGYHFDQPWWIIAVVAVVSWLASVALSFAAFWNAKPN